MSGPDRCKTCDGRAARSGNTPGSQEPRSTDLMSRTPGVVGSKGMEGDCRTNETIPLGLARRWRRA
jgi:hypothetical protein